MIIVVLLIGMLLVVSGIKGTETELAQQLEGDLFGKQGSTGFLYWLVAIIVLGSLGYIPYLEKPAKYLIGLVIVVMVLANSSVFAQLFNALPAIEAQGPAHSVPLPQVASATQQSSSSGGGGLLGIVTDIAGVALAPETGGASLLVAGALSSQGY